MKAQTPTVNLNSVQDGILYIDDFDYSIAYKQVLTPPNISNEPQKTSLFTVHYRNNTNNEEWKTCNGTLTSEYTATVSELVLKQLQSQANIEVLTSHFKIYKDTYTKLHFTIKGFDTDDQPISETDRIMFQLITNLNIDELKVKKAITFNLINSINGCYKLTLNYNLMSMIYNDSDPNNIKSLKIINPYILDSFCYRLVHNSKLNFDVSILPKIKNDAVEREKLFKNYSPDDKLFELLQEVCKKRFHEIMVNTYNALPESCKNLYYLTSIISYMIQNNGDLSTEFRIRNTITQYISKHL